MVKLITRCGFTLIALIAAVMIGGYAWLRSGPISNEELTALLADALSAPDGSYSATIGSASLNWQDFDELGTVRVERVVLRDSNGNIFANFPRLRATLNPLAWVIGGQKISELAMLRPQLYVQKNSDGHWMLGFNGDTPGGVPLAGVLTPFSGDDHAKSGPGMRGFDRLLIYGAQLYISDEQAGTMLSSTNAHIRATRSGRMLELQLRMPVTYNDINTTIAAAAVVENNGARMAGDIRLNKVPLSLVCKFMQCPEGTGATGTFTGRIAPGFQDGELSELTVQGVGEALKIDLPDWFEETLDIPNLRLNASMLDGGKKFVLRAAEATLATDTSVRIRGIVTKEEAGYGIDGYGELAEPMHVKYLRKYWPITAAAQTREWVMAMLSKGTVPSAHIYVTVKPGDLDMEYLPDSALRAEVNTTGMTVKYLPGFPVVKKLDGTVYFTGETLRIEATKGDFMKASKLGATTLTCDALNHPNVPMKVTLGLDADAADAATLLKMEHFTFDDTLKLNADAISGRVNGQVTLGFNAFSESDDGKPHFENVTYDTELALNNVGQKHFADAFDVSGFSGDLAARAGLFTLKGAGTFDGHTLNVDLEQKDSSALRAGIVGTLTAKAVKGLAGDDVGGWLTGGTLGVDVLLNYSNSAVGIERATIDATKAALDVPPISFVKTVGEKGSVSLKKTGDDASTLALDATLGKLKATGSVKGNSKTGALEQVRITRLTAPGNDFGLTYNVQGDGFTVDLKGKQLDARTSYASTENSLLADFPNMRLNLDLESLLLYEIPFTQLRGHLDCLNGPCIDANLSAIVGKGNLSARILPVDGKRTLEVDSGDAGDLLRALDITDRMFEGKMQVRGTYDDAQSPAPLNARLLIHDFTLKNSELLARLFSIGSLSGLANALTGSGIAFDKMAATIDAKQGVFKLSDGQAKGNAMGFTVKGTVDTTKASLNLKGVLVPAFFLNSFIGNIPIIGEIAGGAGEGLIAFNYSIKGPYADPQTSVNPLSGLTPGFLRGIFSAFDGPAEGATPTEGAPAQQAPTPVKPEPAVKRN